MRESGEMYLETILILGKKMNHVRAVDICAHMGFSKPSVSRALARLREEAYVLVDREGFIALTEKGHEIADKIYERHQVLASTLRYLGVSESTALSDACKMEHVISDETFEAIKRHQK